MDKKCTSKTTISTYCLALKDIPQDLWVAIQPYLKSKENDALFLAEYAEPNPTLYQIPGMTSTLVKYTRVSDSQIRQEVNSINIDAMQAKHNPINKNKSVFTPLGNSARDILASVLPIGGDSGIMDDDINNNNNSNNSSDSDFVSKTKKKSSFLDHAIFKADQTGKMKWSAPSWPLQSKSVYSGPFPQPYSYTLTGDDDSPLLAHVAEGSQVVVLENDCMIAPIAYHPIKRREAIIKISVQSNGQVLSAELLPLIGYGFVGQIEPKIVLPRPNSIEGRQLSSIILKANVIRRLYNITAKFKNRKERFTEPFHDSLLFKGYSEVSDKKSVRSLLSTWESDGLIQRLSKDKPDEKHKFFILQPNNIFAMDPEITHVQICQYYSMQMARILLCSRGILYLTNFNVLERIMKGFKVISHIKIANFIRQQLDIAAWKITGEFKERKNNCLLQLYGRGNPLFEGMGYSFISSGSSSRKRTGNQNKKYLMDKIEEPKKKFDKHQNDHKLASRNNKDCEEEKEEDNAVYNDNRKYKVSRIDYFIGQLGVDVNSIESYDRWERLRFAQSLANIYMAMGGKDPHLLSLVRTKNKRFGDSRQMEYQEDVHELFIALLYWMHYGTKYEGIEVDDDVMSDEFVHRFVNGGNISSYSYSSSPSIQVKKEEAAMTDEELYNEWFNNLNKKTEPIPPTKCQPSNNGTRGVMTGGGGGQEEDEDVKLEKCVALSSSVSILTSSSSSLKRKPTIDENDIYRSVKKHKSLSSSPSSSSSPSLSSSSSSPSYQTPEITPEIIKHKKLQVIDMSMLTKPVKLIQTVVTLNKNGTSESFTNEVDASLYKNDILIKIEKDLKDGGTRFPTHTKKSVATLGIVKKGKLYRRVY